MFTLNPNIKRGDIVAEGATWGVAPDHAILVGSVVQLSGHVHSTIASRQPPEHLQAEPCVVTLFGAWGQERVRREIRLPENVRMVRLSDFDAWLEGQKRPEIFISSSEHANLFKDMAIKATGRSVVNPQTLSKIVPVASMVEYIHQHGNKRKQSTIHSYRVVPDGQGGAALNVMLNNSGHEAEYTGYNLLRATAREGLAMRRVPPKAVPGGAG